MLYELQNQLYADIAGFCTTAPALCDKFFNVARLYFAVNSPKARGNNIGQFTSHLRFAPRYPLFVPAYRFAQDTVFQARLPYLRFFQQVQIDAGARNIFLFRAFA